MLGRIPLLSSALLLKACDAGIRIESSARKLVPLGSTWQELLLAATLMLPFAIIAMFDAVKFEFTLKPLIVRT